MSTVQRRLTAAFYWTGIALTMACFALVLAGNTELFGRFQHANFHLSWGLGSAAVLAFMATELCGSMLEQNRGVEAQARELAAGLEALR